MGASAEPRCNRCYRLTWPFYTCHRCKSQICIRCLSPALKSTCWDCEGGDGEQE